MTDQLNVDELVKDLEAAEVQAAENAGKVVLERDRRIQIEAERDALRDEVVRLRESCAAIVEEYLRAYPTDIFVEPPPRQHGQTVDACSAAALRAVLPNIARGIRAIEISSAPTTAQVNKDE